MINFNKVLTSKIISLAIAVSFILADISYAGAYSQGSLRVPVGKERTYGRMGEVAGEQRKVPSPGAALFAIEPERGVQLVLPQSEQPYSESFIPQWPRTQPQAPEGFARTMKGIIDQLKSAMGELSRNSSILPPDRKDRERPVEEKNTRTCMQALYTLADAIGMRNNVYDGILAEARDAAAVVLSEANRPQEKWTLSVWYSFLEDVFDRFDREGLVNKGWLLQAGFTGDRKIGLRSAKVFLFDIVPLGDEKIIIAEIEDQEAPSKFEERFLAGETPAASSGNGRIITLSHQLIGNERIYKGQYRILIVNANNQLVRTLWPDVAEVFSRITIMTESDYARAFREIALWEEWMHSQDSRRVMKEIETGRNLTTSEKIELILALEPSNPIQDKIKSLLLDMERARTLPEPFMLGICVETRALMRKLLYAPSAAHLEVALCFAASAIVNSQAVEPQQQMNRYAANLVLFAVDEALKGHLETVAVNTERDFARFPAIVALNPEQLMGRLRILVRANALTTAQPQSAPLATVSGGEDRLIAGAFAVATAITIPVNRGVRDDL